MSSAARPQDPPHEDDPGEERIVVGVDGSDDSIRALQWGAFMARTMGVRLDALAAWHYPTEFGYAWAGLAMEWNPAEDARKALAAAVRSALGEDLGDLDVRQSAMQGYAARVLVEESASARMLVLGSRGHGGFAGLLLGSVSMSAAEHARCPVLVVHATRPLRSRPRTSDEREARFHPGRRTVAAIAGRSRHERA